MLAIVALCGGCARRTEGTADASAGRPAEGQSSQAVQTAPAPQQDGGAARPMVGGEGGAAAEGGRAAEEACVDRWLEGRQLDRYGSPRGTMYMGGTPLFDERTGESTDRLVFVYRKHAEARAACAGDAGTLPPPPGPAHQ